MLIISVKEGFAKEEVVDACVILHTEKIALRNNKAWKELGSEFGKEVLAWLEEREYKGKQGEFFVMPTLGRLKAKQIACLGLGEKQKMTTDVLRRLGAQLVKKAKSLKAKNISILWPQVGASEQASRAYVEAFAEGAWLGTYTFHTYKGKLHEAQIKDASVVESLTLCVSNRSSVRILASAVEEARIFTDATILARSLVDTPSGHMGPEELAKVAEQIAKTSQRISVERLNVAKMRALGMEAALAVGKGSDQEPVGIHLIYHPKGKAKKKIALIGKAVTFDSGGLSLKPADGMMTMKIDMAGAAAVLGVFQALASLPIEVEVHGIFLGVENMPSGKAYRPGDIVKAMNGVTIEVLNTDAEGRVTLADALSYAQTLKPNTIIDLATLTGACVAALGEEIAGIMSPDEKLQARLLASAKLAGEPLWPLPLHAPYQELIKSKVADIKNIGGGRSGGAITAGLFLQHFVNKETSWAHLDIAGPAYVEKETRGDLPFGGTGYGVRTLLRYLQSIE